MAMASGFMCYIKQDDIEKGVICSQYIHNVWNEDLTSHNINLVFDIASDLPMRYLAFAITANSWEWEVLYVHDRQGASTTASVTIPEYYLGTVKLGIKLYDTPPTVGSVMHVGYDYVITGGIDLISSDGTEKIEISCDTEGADIRYTTDDSEPTESSNQYTGVLSVTAPATIKARAYKDGLLPSDMVELIIEKPLPVPVLQKQEGTAIDNCIIVISNYSEYTDAVLRYTTDNTDPTETSTQTTGQIAIDENCTVKVKAFTSDKESEIALITVSDIKVQTPVIEIVEE